MLELLKEIFKSSSFRELIFFSSVLYSVLDFPLQFDNNHHLLLANYKLALWKVLWLLLLLLRVWSKKMLVS